MNTKKKKLVLTLLVNIIFLFIPLIKVFSETGKTVNSVNYIIDKRGTKFVDGHSKAPIISIANHKAMFEQGLRDSLEAMANELVHKLVVDRSNLPVYNVVKDFQFDNTGVTLITTRFQHVIDSCTAIGPSRFYFPKGAYLTGTIILKSGANIEFEEGAKIIGSTEPKDYIEIYPEYKANTDQQVDKSLFYAEKVDGISFTGNGVIDFQGNNPVYLNTGNNDKRRPFGIRIVSSKNIYINGLMLWNSPQWMQHYLDCENVMIENINVFNHAHQNNDGIDIDGSRNVYLRNSQFDSDDDAICLKSNGLSKCENILIEDCIAASHCNALKLGTETTGGFKNIMYRNCKVIQSVTGSHHVNGAKSSQSAISLIITDGGEMKNVWFDHIQTHGCVTPVFVTLGNRSRKHTTGVPKPGIGRMENVTISNFTATGAGPRSSSITGLDSTHYLKNVTLENIKIELAKPGDRKDRDINMDELLPRVKSGYPSPHVWNNLPSSAFYFRYIDGLNLNNISIETNCQEARETIILKECTGVYCKAITSNDKKYNIK